MATILDSQNNWRKEASCWLVISETLTCDSYTGECEQNMEIVGVCVDGDGLSQKTGSQK